MFRQLLVRGFAESGLQSLCRCHKDVKLICLQRFVRMFAYGATTLHLVAYLEVLGFSATRIGLFMALTLVGDTCISLVLTSCADGVGRRLVLALGAALMVASGVAFGLCDSFWMLLAAAVFGVISPGGNEIGPFRAVEESIVAHLTTADDRSDVYAWYSLVGAAGTAVGAMASGWTAQSLTSNSGWSNEAAYRAVFYGYSTLGVFKLALVLLLSRDSEAEPEAHDEDETTPILGAERAESQVETAGWRRKLLPGIQKSSFPVVIPLCLLFALDSFASSLTPQSWIAFFFRWKFDMDNGLLGSMFFVCSFLAVVTTLVASSLAKRIGNLNTMVFTHLPSAVFTALLPFPQSVNAAIVFLILRALTQSMDVAPRAAFVAGILKPKERTTVMGLVNVLKTAAQSVGPLGVGVLVDRNLFWVAFVSAGCLKVVYDLGLMVCFRKSERREEDGPIA
ncbi:major facilitator superfamily transporter [Colletotrichum gloeosporioides Cg-14]|uniref:Major facilitator superfamily transporter n=1 Tax=Colletotrichum gloeosporioides (strain Cg-14) TaxID=1237896 RepID=T0M553_COLGC|nr:major facilitator superfamily transporter [Colletotrichum gloeosporioides Cg-14]